MITTTHTGKLLRITCCSIGSTIYR
uniref:Uncharacterized protein n=1 Tax=Tetranychus urticae TaxID=32264 RepID=T1JUW4_TETUR